MVLNSKKVPPKSKKSKKSQNKIKKDGEHTLEDKITDTVDYLISHDRREIEKLFKAFEKEQTINK